SPRLVMSDRNVRIRASQPCTRADFMALLPKRQTHKSPHWRSARMATDTLAPQTASPAPPSMHRMIVAAMIGNVLEWFDFVVYGFFAVTIAEVFFPTDNPTVSLLITFGAFGLAYFVRPLGAIVVGSYTDRAGRKARLLLSIAVIMCGP